MPNQHEAIARFKTELMRTTYRNALAALHLPPEELSPEIVDLQPWIAPSDCPISSFSEYPGANRIILDPDESTPITIAATRDHFPVVNNHLLPPLFLMRRSTRSCIAQVGGHATPSPDLDSYLFTPKDAKALARGKTVHLPHVLVNSGPNPLIFEPGDQLVRFFFTNSRYMAVGEGLIWAIAHGLVEGEFGKDFTLLDFEDDHDFPQGNGLPLTIALKIASRRLVPKTTGPLRITSRQDVYEALEPATENTDPALLAHPFQLRETRSILHLPENVVGELSLFTTSGNPSPQLGAEFSQQIGSRLIDPQTNWRVRVETAGPHPVDWVFLSLFWTNNPGVVALPQTYHPSLR